MHTAKSHSKTGIRYMPLEPQAVKPKTHKKQIILGLLASAGALALWRWLKRSA